MEVPLSRFWKGRWREEALVGSSRTRIAVRGSKRGQRRVKVRRLGWVLVRRMVGVFDISAVGSDAMVVRYR